jgi:molybdopterin-guanine dinucleotide biosynthesis protein A
VEFDAIILAGGRSSRLGGVPKSGLIYDGATLLERSLGAAGAAGRAVVVGPDPGDLPEGVLTCREDPPFAGPAAAIAAGLAALAANHAAAPAPFTLVLACDMPRSAEAVRALAAALGESLAASVAVAPERAPKREGGDGVMAVSADGRKQPLAGFYSTAALQRCVADAAGGGSLENASVFALLARLDVREVRVPPGSTDDVDTWDDASALGVSGRIPGRGPGSGPELRS